MIPAVRPIASCQKVMRGCHSPGTTRITVPESSWPIDFDTKAPLEDELDMVVLDTVSRAGDRFGRLLHMLAGHSSTA
jgi:hypothetical protein